MAAGGTASAARGGGHGEGDEHAHGRGLGDGGEGGGDVAAEAGWGGGGERELRLGVVVLREDDEVVEVALGVVVEIPGRPRTIRGRPVVVLGEDGEVGE